MALFRNVRKRKEEKRQEEAKKLQEAIESGISGYEISPEEMKDGKKLQHFIIQSCEEIIEASKELEEEKAEYRIVTEYLNDIQMLEEMPAEDMNEIKSAAESVQKLDKLRDEYHNAVCPDAAGGGRDTGSHKKTSGQRGISECGEKRYALPGGGKDGVVL